MAEGPDLSLCGEDLVPACRKLSSCADTQKEAFLVSSHAWAWQAPVRATVVFAAEKLTFLPPVEETTIYICVANHNGSL